MRISALLLSLLLGFSVTTRLQAQNPDAQQDAEAAREKLLKAEDQLDNIQANSESTKTAVEAMKTDVTRLQGDVATLQADNAALKKQVADLQAALDESKAATDKKLKIMVDSVAAMLAKGSGPAKGPPKKKDAATTTPDASQPKAAQTSPAPAPSTPPTTGTPTDKAAASAASATPDATPAPVKTQKGYYHIVASGETLTLICNAYRQDGVNVSVADIRKANGLTDKSVLKVGQKLFIPKPGI